MKTNNDKTKISFISLGCDKNLVDSEIMLGLIAEEGYELTENDEDANVIIINTCGFILDATEESIENILRLEDYKTEGNCKGLIVTGCMAQRYEKEIFNELPFVDAVVGTGDFEKIGVVIKNVLNNEKGEKLKYITDINRKLDENLSHKRILSTPPYFAYLKISEGCDRKCTYCTIPALRGKYRSRTIESLVKEAEILGEKGVKEIVLVAQDSAIYGKDIYNESKLHTLLQELSKIPTIQWIRILYCYPEHVTDDLISEMASNSKVCNYLDMPIQHSDDNVLKRMARGSSEEKIRNVVNRLRSKVPGISLRTTLITGFPMESDEEFENLAKFVQEMKFNKLGVFTYSQEENTVAAQMDGQVDEDIKNKRKEYIMELQKNISSKICDTFVGKTMKVIVDGKLPDENIFCGRSYMDCLDIDGLVFFKADFEPVSGDFVNVKITEASDYDLIGVVENEYEPTK